MESNLNITAIIQARISSSRFPEKVLKKFNGKTIMQIMYSRIKKSNYVNKIVFAIPKNKKEKKLKNHLSKNNFSFFEGHNNNLLDISSSFLKLLILPPAMPPC